MRISAWSSDVFSSDLPSIVRRRPSVLGHPGYLPDEVRARYDWGSPGRRAFSVSLHNTPHRLRTRGAFFVGDSVKNRHSCWRFQRVSQCAAIDRKSVVSGKSVSVRVDLGGRRCIKTKKTTRREGYDILNNR